MRGRAGLAVAIVAFGLGACGGQSVNIAPSGSGSAPVSLAAAVVQNCFSPSTLTQSPPLPAAAGVSGTLSIGAFPSASTQCISVTLATGTDATLQSGATTPNARVRRLNTTSGSTPNPLLQVSLTNTFDGTMTWYSLTLQLPPGSIPAGQYPCRIASTVDLADGSVYVTYTNFTVTISDTGMAVVTGPSGAQALSILGADTTGVLAIYPPGSTLPSPTPTDAATPSPSPTPTGSATPAPTATPTPVTTVAPTNAPTPTPTPTGALAVSLDPDTCVDAGSNGFSQTYTASVNMPPPTGRTWAYAWTALANQPAYTVNVPPPMAPVGTYGTLGTGDTATIVVPAFATSGTGETGESGAVLVTLYVFTGYDSNGNPTGVPAVSAQGTAVQAGAPLEAGSVTCQSQGLSKALR